MDDVARVSMYLTDHDLAFETEARSDGSTWLHLQPCPFGCTSQRKDSSIRISPEGKPGFKCLHANCPGMREAAESGRSGWRVLTEKIGGWGREYFAEPRGEANRTAAEQGNRRGGGPKAKATAADQDFQFDTRSWEELMRLEIPLSWLVRGILVAGQPCAIGGAGKSLKTSIALDLLVSLATSTPFLGQFPTAAGPQTCFAISGESGEFVLRDTVQRVLRSRGLPYTAPDKLLHISTKIPRMSMTGHVVAVEREIKRLGASVMLLDPAYLALLSAEFGELNLFSVGSVLREFSDVAAATGCTLILIHHFRKAMRSRTGIPQRPALEDFSYAGFSEWARQWFLVGRRSAFVPGSGLHDLSFEIGGSMGQSGLWAVDIDEGQPEDVLQGREWAVTVGPFEEPADPVRGGTTMQEDKSALYLGYLKSFLGGRKGPQNFWTIEFRQYLKSINVKEDGRTILRQLEGSLKGALGSEVIGTGRRYTADLFFL